MNINKERLSSEVQYVEDILSYIDTKSIKELEYYRDNIIEFARKVEEEIGDDHIMTKIMEAMEKKKYPKSYISKVFDILYKAKEKEIEEKKKEAERKIKEYKTLIDEIGKSITKELKKATLNTTQIIWTRLISIDLSVARTSPVFYGSYPLGDCITYLPDSDGVVTVYLDNPNSHGYKMGTNYLKLRYPFNSIYIENTAQSGFCYLRIGRGNIEDLQTQYTVIIDSTTTPLGAGASWTSSSWFDALNYGYITVLASADVSGTLYLQYSNDGVNIHNETKATMSPTTLSTGATIYTATIMSARPARYVRPAFVNGTGAQSSFNLTALARTFQ